MSQETGGIKFTNVFALGVDQPHFKWSKATLLVARMLGSEDLEEPAHPPGPGPSSPLP